MKAAFLSLAHMRNAITGMACVTVFAVGAGACSNDAINAIDAIDASGDADIDTPADIAAPIPPCDDPALTPIPFAAPTTAATAPWFTGPAGDFVLQTWQGPRTAAELRAGCNSIVFIVHFPGINDGLLDSDPTLLVTEARTDNHFVFMSDAETLADREAALMRLGTRFDRAINRVADPVERELRRSRFHFATDRARAVEGSPGEHLRGWIAWSQTGEAVVDLGERGRANPPAPQVFGIRPDHHFDPGDALLSAVGASDSLGMAAFLGHHYAFRNRLDTERGTAATTVVIANEATTARTLVKTLDIPNITSDRNRWNTIHLDVDVRCDEGNPFSCSEWDRLAHAYVCMSDDCTTTEELARWVTPYWRRGEQAYRFDVSLFSAWLAPGTRVTLKLELGPEWERPTPWHVRASLAFEDRTDAPTPPRGLLPLFRSGPFDGSRDDAEVTVDIPAAATRFALVAIVSGHGQAAPDNCAEWCDHRHVFSIDGKALPAIAHVGAPVGSALGCARRASEGVLPGQWGNWPQARAYWCPGLAVPVQRIDATALVTAGSQHTVRLRSYLGADGTPSGGDIALGSWLAWW